MQENQISHVFCTFLLLTEEDMASCSRAFRKPKNAENELESLLPTDLEFEVSDDVLSNMPLPDYCTNGIENFSRCLFHNCTINLVQK